MKQKYLIGGLIVLIAIAYLSYAAFQNSATYYFTVSEFTQQKESIGSKNVRINGQVATDYLANESGSLRVKFTIVESGESLPVVYQGVIPDTFKAGNEVVVEGYLGPDGIFQANSILTKCPSKYDPE